MEGKLIILWAFRWKFRCNIDSGLFIAKNTNIGLCQ